jgi:hypothetical protein
MGSYDTPNAAEMYFNRSIFGHLFTAIAGIPPLPRHRKSPARAVAAARQSAPERRPKPTLLDRLDAWFWRQLQKDREAYLAQASDVFDLERRIDAIERGDVTHG